MGKKMLNDSFVQRASPPRTAPRYADRDLFDCGTLIKFRMRAGRARERERNIVARALLTILIGWIPLVVLSTWQSAVLDQAGLDSFLSDFAVSCRSLVAAPVLVLAEWTCLPRLG